VGSHVLFKIPRLVPFQRAKGCIWSRLRKYANAIATEEVGGEPTLSPDNSSASCLKIAAIEAELLE
jgi:hypothetical protein